MAERLDGEVALWVQVKEELVDRVGPAHRADFQSLIQKGKILVFDRGGEFVHLLEPQGALSFLRKACVNVIGPAPTPTA